MSEATSDCGMTGKQVRLFLVEGTTGGLVTAEIINWTGHVIAAPRSRLDQLSVRPETTGTGVYVLLGDDPNARYEVRAYIGEGDSVDARLRAHARPSERGGKDFWDRAIVISSKDANITKAHARYLESRLLQIALQARRCSLDNGTAPTPQQLPEADRSDMEYFIGQLQIVLPVLGVQIFRLPKLDDQPPASESGVDRVRELSGTRSSPVLRIRVTRTPERFAVAREIDSEFVVQGGSYASAVEGVMSPGYRAVRQKCISDGLLVAVTGEPSVLQWVEDTVFRSPSEAASVCTGGSENGRRRWIAEDGTSFGVWQADAEPDLDTDHSTAPD